MSTRQRHHHRVWAGDRLWAGRGRPGRVGYPALSRLAAAPPVDQSPDDALNPPQTQEMTSMMQPRGPRRRSLMKAALAVPAVGIPLVGLADWARAALPAAGSTSRYTMTAFTNSNETDMYVYQAPDATGFRLLRGPAYTPPSGKLRDPSVFRHTDGYYYLTYTPQTFSVSNNYIGFARSADRLNWTFLGNVTLGLSGIGNAWAPEWFIDSDGSVNVIVSLHFTSGASGTFQPYKITATNSALSSWSTPVPLSGIPAGYIDTFLVKIGATYYAFCKSTSTMSIDFARASNLAGPYTLWKTGNFVSYDGEGPALVALDNGGWRMYFDGYRVGKYWFTDSYDTFQTWSTPAELPGVSGFVRHFTVLKETVSGGATLPTGRHSLQSVNYPGRYWHVTNSLGYVDPVTSTSDTATKQAASFTVVAGLADGNGYSFVAADGRYLRHYAFRLRLDPSDGSATFNNDATFVARPGTASGSVSLESYNFPGRYIRHRNFELWADLYQDSDTFRADSSFTAANPWA
jgi:hypothetical protein